MSGGIIVSDLIRSSMRLIGAIATGETPSAEEVTDGLLVLNDMLENWSTETLSVWGSSNQTFILIANQATYSIGPAGNWNTTRPQDIDGAYCTFGGVDFPIEVISQQQYNDISIKSMKQPITERLLYVNEFPLGVVAVWPVPTQNTLITLTMSRVLAFPVAVTDVLTGPPGFLKALRYCLAVEFAPEFGIEASATVIQVAADAKGDYKRANIPLAVSSYDDALTTPQVAIYQRGY